MVISNAQRANTSTYEQNCKILHFNNLIKQMPIQM